MGGQRRASVAALDATTGVATAWNPAADGEVFTLAVDGQTIYAGGSFSTIGGHARNYVAALDATTGLATAWDPGADALYSFYVHALVVSGSTVYAGGHFNAMGGQPRENLAALDVTTGLATAWNPGADADVWTLVADASTVYAGGYFSTIGGQSRSRLAALDATTGLATSWDPAAIGQHVHVLARDGTTLYVGGDFSSMGGQSRTRIAALDVASGLATAWNPVADGDYVDALEVSGSTVYAGGRFSSVGGRSRRNLAALDATTGFATAWDPGADGSVYAMRVVGSTVYAGGGFSNIGGQSHPGIAALQDSPTPTLLVRFDAEATNAGILLRWQFGDPRVLHVTPERSEYRQGPWTQPLVESRSGADAVEALDASAVPGERYWYRLIAELADGTRTTFGPIDVAAVAGARTSGITAIAPNPATADARIDFALVRSENVRISVVDVAGREVAVLVNGPMAPGSYSMVWDRRRTSLPLPAGAYFVRWASTTSTMTRRLVITR
jgi:hypothetical protein